MAEIKMLSGNLACTEAALRAGVRFFAGYPITPASEIAESMARRMPQVGGVFIQMEDEIASLSAVIGASLAGVKALTATSGPGFALMQESVGLAVMLEVPCVIINVQRVGPSTGMATLPAQGDVMMARWGTQGDHPIIALSPWSVPECYELTIEAINFSERFRTPVILLSDAIISRLREAVALPDEVVLEERPRPKVGPAEYKPYEAGPDQVPPMADYGTGYRWHATSTMHDERGWPKADDPTVARRFLTRLHGKIYDRKDEIIRVDGRWLEDAELVVVAFGAVARSALAAVKAARQQGLKVGLLRLITLWPFPEEIVANLASHARAFVVAEMNMGQCIDKVRESAAGRAPVYPCFRFDGQYLEPQQIREAVQEVVKKWK